MIDKIIPFSVMNYLFTKYNKKSNIDSQDLNKLREISGGTEQLREALAILRESDTINKDLDISVIETKSGIPILELKKPLDIEDVLTERTKNSSYLEYKKSLSQLEAMQKFNRIINSTNNINKQNKLDKEEIRRQAYAKVIKSLNNSNNIGKHNEENIDKEKKDKKQSKKNGAIKFIGILGENCGEVIKATEADEIRIFEKGFKVKDGIKVLRGFAKSSDLATYSKKDENYQRSSNDEHLKEIEHFIEKIRTSAKYLPEVTLVARGDKNLKRVKISGKLTTTQQGEIDNLEYYELTVFEDNLLYRIDGNHRLEALKDKNYYIPFSIIIWNNESVSVDDEAFLFYFLNSKAKPLTTEENLKGLVNSTTWESHELKEANFLLPYLKYFRDDFENNPLFNKEHYKDSDGLENPKIQILKILDIILKEDGRDNFFDFEVFKNYISETNEILSQRDRFKYLRKKFLCFPQFVFYTLHKKKGSFEETVKFLDETNSWAECYKHDENSIIYPNKIYNNAYKQLDKKINIFVAMPFYNESIVKQFNKTMKELICEIMNENSIFADKLNLFDIMTYKAESTDILGSMDYQINKCDIFIADISNHNKAKANPNVMFELGRVFDKKNFILIRNKKNKIKDSAFDIRHYDFIDIDFEANFDISMKENLKPRILQIAKNILMLKIR